MANPIALYSHQGQEPQPLPDEISWYSDSNMMYRTDVNSFTDEELTKAGYTGPYEVPSIDIQFQKIRWNSENCSYVVEDISDKELWDKIRIERNRRLSETDWLMATDVKTGLNGEPLRKWELYRQRLRDLPSVTENPRYVVWPVEPQNDTDFELVTHDRSDKNSVRYRLIDLEDKVDQLYKKVFPIEYIPDPNQN